MGGRTGHRKQLAQARVPAGVVVPCLLAELDQPLLHNLVGQLLVVEHLEAEPEQLHAVLAVKPSRRIVVVLSGDAGDQAYLVRPGPYSAAAPRHGCPQTKYYEINLPIGSFR